MGFPLGVTFSAVVILFALYAAYCIGTEEIIVTVASVFGLIAFAIIISWGTAVSKINAKRTNDHQVENSIDNTETSDNAETASTKTVKNSDQTRDKYKGNDYEDRFWCRANYVFWHIIDVLKSVDGLITAIATAMLFIATTILGVIAVYQLRAAKNDQRPWVGLQSIKLTPSPIAILDVYHTLVIANSGKSPAFHVYISLGDWNKDPHSMKFPTDKCNVGCIATDIEILPQSSISIEIPLELGVPPSPHVGDTVWVVGRIDYDDSDGTPHKTGFCSENTSRLVVSAIPGARPIVAGSQKGCSIPNSNYAD